MTDALFVKILGGGATGVIATLLLVLLLILREDLVVGAVFRRTLTRLGKYEDMAMRAMRVAERATPAPPPEKEA